MGGGTPSKLARALSAALPVTAALILSTAASAAEVTTAAVQAAGQDWNLATIWSNNAAPSAGNTYRAIAGGGPTRLRNPAVAGIQTFAGDSLTLDANTEIRSKGVAGTVLNFPGVGGNAGLILNGGQLNTGDEVNFGLAGKVSVVADSNINNFDSNNPNNITVNRAWTISAAVIGNGKLTISRGRTVDANGAVAPAVELTGVNNAYSGTWQVDEGFLKGTGANSLGSGNLIINGTLINGTTLGAAWLETDYDIVSTGTLTVGALGVIRLDQNDTFSAVTINGTPLTPGTHSYAELAAAFPANFAPGGSGSNGSITIPSVPEPTTLGALGMASLALIARRRRQA